MVHTNTNTRKEHKCFHMKCANNKTHDAKRCCVNFIN